jgi:pimeloyl-ACP methyl ester carboxylesterase
MTTAQRYEGDLVTSYRVGDLTIVDHVTPASAATANQQFVLVHGIGVSSRYFGPTAAALAGHGTVHAIDLPGYGRSPKAARDVSIADHAEALAGFLQQAGIRDPVVVGHSMGSQVVSQLAVDAPELICRLVLIAPTMPPHERSLARGAWHLFLDAQRNPLAADRVILADYVAHCGPAYFLAQTRHLFADAIELRAPSIPVPTLVIAGDHDLVVPVDWARTVADLIPDARLRVVAGPHVVMYHEPELLASIIAEHTP